MSEVTAILKKIHYHAALGYNSMKCESLPMSIVEYLEDEEFSVEEIEDDQMIISWAWDIEDHSQPSEHYKPL